MVKKDSSYKEVNHEYTYDFNSNRILKESSYSVFDHNLDGIPDKEVPNYFASYIYNNKDQLVSKTFDMSKTWWGEGVLMPDHNLQLEGGKETPIETYTYDAVGNLTSVYTYANAAKTVLVHTEDYFYNNNNQLVRLLRRKATGMMGAFNRHFKRLNEFFFNDKGDVIQINSYENDEKTIHATYFYEYSGYDKYYNWTHMEMRIKDVPTKEPTMVADRIIEYYEE
jgi:hypothetical protein